MIPLKLSLAGLYSYQQQQDIDFQQLTQAELFGIFGSTGSGKSSILEAISLALYNQTERLNRSESGGRAYHMMNLKSQRMLVDFEFAAGPGEAERFRFRVTCKRNRKDFYDTGSFQRQAYHWQGHEWLPIPDKDAAAILGLSYEHFKRTIIIPQGKFEEFIQLKSTERAKMLQDIFGLDKYELSGQVRTLTQKNEVSLQTHQHLLSQYAQVSEDVIKQNATEIIQLENTRQAVEAAFKEQGEKRSHLQQLRDQVAQLQQRQDSLNHLRQQQPAMEEKQQQLDRYLLAMDRFSVLLSDQRRANTQLQDLDKRLATKRDTLQQGELALQGKRKTFAQVEQQYQGRDQFREEIEDLQHIFHLQELAGTIAAQAKRVQKGTNDIHQAERRIESLEAEVQAAEQLLNTLEQDRPDTGQLLALNQWFAEQRRLQERLDQQRQMLSQLQAKIEAGREEKHQLARQVGIDLSQYELSTAKLIERLETQLAQDQAQRQEIAQQQQQLHLQEALFQLAEDLAAGDPCPLCGATEHPAMVHQPAHAAQLSSLASKMERLEQSLTQIHQTLPAFQVLLNNAKDLARERKDVQEALGAIQQELDLHQSRFIWEAYSKRDEASLQQQLAKAEHVTQQIRAQQQLLKDKRDAIRLEQKQLQEWRPTLSHLEGEWRSRQGEFKHVLAQLKHLRYDDFAAHDKQVIQAQINERQRAYDGVEQLYQTLRSEVDEQRQRLASLEGELSALARAQQDTVSELARLNQRLDEKLGGTPFSEIDTVRKTLELALDIEAEGDAIKTFKRELTEAETSLRDLQQQIGDQQFDPKDLEAVEIHLQALEAQIASLTQEIGGKITYGQRLEQDLIEKHRLEKELERLSLRGDNLKIFTGLFRGNGFVSYLSTTFLENLCAEANARFLKLTNNSLSLEVDGDNNFHVRDLLNGGHRRSIKTLSGGQTFQAALCLALALSDQVQQQVQARQNFFFLDEGFGSQDRQSLQTIFHTLKSLRQENRIVGVISHVEELQQEIDTHLRITNHPERGSIVQGSWQG